MYHTYRLMTLKQLFFIIFFNTHQNMFFLGAKLFYVKCFYLIIGQESKKDLELNEIKSAIGLKFM